MLPSEWDVSSPSASNSLSLFLVSPLSHRDCKPELSLITNSKLPFSCLDLLSLSVKEESSPAGAICVRALG